MHLFRGICVIFFLVGKFSLSTSLRCGISNVNPVFSKTCFANSGIVNGDISKESSWPWMAGIYIKIGNYKKFLCGGTIISQRSILTAGHCIKPLLLNKYVVLVGNNSRGNGQEFGVSIGIVHPNYVITQNDVGLIILRARLTYSYKVRPVCLAQMMDSNSIVGRKAYLLGWGYTSENGIESDILRQVCLPIINTRQCRSSYTHIPLLQIQGSIHICAGYNIGMFDACQNDSGGPLILKDNSNRWFQVGIVSFGEGCARKNRYGVYTNVAYFSDWISNNMVY